MSVRSRLMLSATGDVATPEQGTVQVIPTYTGDPSTLERYKTLLQSTSWHWPWVEGYWRAHFERLCWSADKVAEFAGPTHTRLLELGAMPYVMTVLLREHFPHIVTNNANGDVVKPQDVHLQVNGEMFAFQELRFNVETARPPAEDDSFDVVVCSELIEHLTFDPMHMLLESRRLLREGGLLFVSTPNSISYRGMEWAIDGATPNVDPFYRKNPANRHNRELSPRELHHLVECAGFDVQEQATISFRPNIIKHNWLYEGFQARGDLDLRGDFQYVLAVKNAAKPIDRYPEKFNLYRAMDFLPSPA